MTPRARRTLSFPRFGIKRRGGKGKGRGEGRHDLVCQQIVSSTGHELLSPCLLSGDESPFCVCVRGNSVDSAEVYRLFLLSPPFISPISLCGGCELTGGSLGILSDGKINIVPAGLGRFARRARAEQSAHQIIVMANSEAEGRSV